MRVLVTGATGFVGSAVARALCARGDKVVCLVRQTSLARAAHLRGMGVSLAVGDLGDPASIVRAMEGCQHVYHVAALYDTSPGSEAAMRHVNVDGTGHVIEACRWHDVERLVHTSTIGTIGRPGEDRLPTEDDLVTDPDALTPYARSKLDGELMVLASARDGIPAVVVNPCAPVGIGDVKPSSTGQRIVDCLRGKLPSFLPGGINFVSVDDVAQGHLLAAARGRVGQRYILGHASGNLSREMFYELVGRASGCPRPRGAGGLGVGGRALRRLRSTARRVRDGLTKGAVDRSALLAVMD